MELKIGEKSTILGLSIFERVLVFFSFYSKHESSRTFAFVKERRKIWSIKGQGLLSFQSTTINDIRTDM